MNLSEWRSSAQSFAFSGHQIAYWQAGRGDALLCIHGFPTASWDWHRVWPSLTQRFRTLAADMLGFGLSDKPRNHIYSIDEQAALHEALLESLGVRRAHILAHDYGDTVAQELLARCEDRRRTGSLGLEILSCCFLNGGLFPEAHRARTIQKLLRTPLGPLLSRLSSKRTFTRSLSAVFGPRTRPDAEELDAFWALVSHQDGARIVHELIRYIDERRLNRSRWVGVLETTHIPLRFVNGLADPVSGRHMAQRYREIVPAADVVELEGIGHYPQVEDPEGTLRAVLGFLDGLPGRPARFLPPAGERAT